MRYQLIDVAGIHFLKLLCFGGKSYIDLSVCDFVLPAASGSLHAIKDAQLSITAYVHLLDEGYVKPAFEVLVAQKNKDGDLLKIGVEKNKNLSASFSCSLESWGQPDTQPVLFTNAQPSFAKNRLEQLGHFDDEWLAKEWPHLPSQTDAAYFMQAPAEHGRFEKTADPFQLKLWLREELKLDFTIVPKKYKIQVVFKNKNTLCLDDQLLIDTAYLFPDQACAALMYRVRFPIEDSDGDDVESIEIQEITAQPTAQSTAGVAAAFMQQPSVAALSIPNVEVVAAPLQPALEEPQVTEASDADHAPFASQDVHAVAGEEAAMPPALQAAFAADVDMQELQAHTAALHAQAQALLDEYGLSREDIAQALEQDPHRAHLADFVRAPVDASGTWAPPTSSEVDAQEVPEVDLQALEMHTAALHEQAESLLQEYGLTREDIAQALAANPEMAHLADFMRHSGPQASMPEAEQPQAAVQEGVTNLPDAEIPAMDAVDTAALEEHTRALEAQADALLQEYGLTRQEIAAELEKNPETAHLAALLVDVPQRLEQEKQELQAQLQQALEAKNALNDDAAEWSENSAGDAAFLSDDAAQADALSQGLGAVPLGALGTAALTREQVQTMLALQQPLKGCDISGLDLSQLCFDGVDLRGVNAAQTNFNQCSLRAAKLDGALLQASTWVGADLTEACLQDCSASEAQFTQAVLAQANLRGADCSGAHFDQAVLTQACVSGAQFGKASLQGVDATALIADKASFTEAKLAGANLQQAQLQQADFSDAVCEHTNFSHAQCAEAQFFSTQARNATLQQADLTHSRAGLDADFSGAQLQQAKLHNANWSRVWLTQANFDGAQLDDADFTYSHAMHASFRLATAKQTRLSKMDLSAADLTGVNLFKGSLRKSNLAQTKLHNANLYGVDFEETQPTWASLEGANIGQTMLQFRPPVG